MSEKKIPVAVIAAEVPPRSKASVYPEQFAARMSGRTKSQPGEVFGLANFGVNLARLAPHSVSALRPPLSMLTTIEAQQPVALVGRKST